MPFWVEVGGGRVIVVLLVVAVAVAVAAEVGDVVCFEIDRVVAAVVAVDHTATVTVAEAADNSDPMTLAAAADFDSYIEMPMLAVPRYCFPMIYHVVAAAAAADAVMEMIVPTSYYRWSATISVFHRHHSVPNQHQQLASILWYRLEYLSRELSWGRYRHLR